MNEISETIILRRLALLVPLLFVIGCAPTVIRPALEAGNGLPTTSTRELTQALQTAEKNLRSIDALGKVRISTTENRMRASQVVMAQSPDTFRIEVLGPFGVSYAVASDGKTLAALSTQENVIFRGRPDANTIAEVIGIALAPKDMTSLLLGRPPVQAQALKSLWISNRPASDVATLPESPLYFLHAADGQDTSVVIGFARLIVRKKVRIVPVSFQRIARNGQQLLKASFEAWTMIDGLPLSHRIRIHTAATEAVIEYTEIIPNKALLPGTFRIMTPEGTAERALGSARP